MLAKNAQILVSVFGNPQHWKLFITWATSNSHEFKAIIRVKIKLIRNKKSFFEEIYQEKSTGKNAPVQSRFK